MRLRWQPTLLFASCASLATAYTNFSSTSLLPRGVSVFDERPPNCPPCFNCNLDDFQCQQYGTCMKASGRCACPPGFGGVECAEPLCGHLNATDRAPRPADQQACECDSGWEGINCNVCKTNDACSALMPGAKDGVCYREGLVQKRNHQICDVTNRKIVDQLNPKAPQVTFSCDAQSAECNFQFWVDQVESFYCVLDTCTSSLETEPNRNTTKYICEHIKCSCIADRMLCGQGGSVDIGDFLTEEIKGPASFTSVSTEGGSSKDGSVFSEPAMNDLISTIFGDKTITLDCHSGECLYMTDVPGYEKPIKKINTPLIASVIAGCALLVVAIVVLVWYMSRKPGKSGYGPLHLLRNETDEDAQLMADHKPASLHFENVSYNLAGKQILSGVQGSVHSGELMAIMGASGAGKTTFLDILARKNKKGQSRGDFYINGEKVADDDFRNVIGFVDQDDTMLPTLTVHETIMDSALLRLPRDMTLIAKEQRVDDVERQLGIYHIRDQIIGSEEGNNRGISGGEKRRVGIACELVTSPSILFLDEPTSGLDAYNAYNVVECLVNLVKTYNRTVVFTIHQPRSNIVALFDQLVLLARGRMVYSGPFSTCQSYFDSIGYPCPPGFNIADYLVDLTMHAGLVKEPINDLVDEATEGIYTRSSSTRAVKSVASTSNLSAVPSQYGSPSAESLLRRPKDKRRTSVKQQQERLLFSRKKSNGGIESPGTVQSEEEASLLDQPREASQAWLKLSKQSGNPPPQVLDDSHTLPPDSNATGTDLDALVNSYVSSDVASVIRSEIKEHVSTAHSANGRNPDGATNGHSASASLNRMKGYRKVGVLGQFRILSLRTWRNLYRNPMLMLTHYAIAILLAVLVGTLFYGLTDDIPGFQNRLGIFFFVLALFGFSTLTTLTVFAPERLLFTRERAKGYYAPISYFASKVLFDIVPLRLLPPMILGAIVYPMTGLVPTWSEFWTFIMFLVLFNLAAAAVCLFIGIVFRNLGVANLVGSLVMLFSLLFGGFLLNHETIPRGLLWLQSLSIFHYGFEGLIVNEVKYLSLTDHKYGIDIEVPGSAILSSFGFDVQALWSDAAGLAVFGAIFMVLAYTAMHVLLVEQR